VQIQICNGGEFGMSLAIFDMDKTLLAGDSDHAWGEFLVERGLVNGERYKRANDRFYDAYRAGRLDIARYLAFVLRSLAENDPADLRRWREDFMRDKVRPMITPAARKLVARHRNAGDTLIIITSTIEFVARPIAEEFGVDQLIASQGERIDGRYTGRVMGTPCYREGKVQRLCAWIKEHAQTLTDSWCYSDSHNDLPLLELVDHPVAVNPDAILRQHAESRGWQILTLY
jgi:HAD superfamily hydrolase (TIGR01490 family)